LWLENGTPDAYIWFRRIHFGAAIYWARDVKTRDLIFRIYQTPNH